MTVLLPVSPVRRWEARTEWPLAGLAVIFLANYSVVVLDEHLPTPWRHVCKVVDYSIWAVFLVD